MFARWLLSVLFVLALANVALAKSPAETVVEAQTVLNEALTIPGAEIPAALLRDSHGVAIIPSVLKVGFIGGVRRGHGLVIVKDEKGNWQAPQFVTLTGGSIGWQIGAQSTDVVLVFNSERSVQGMLKGKFTIGADAAASAGPVGRNLAAATDAQLKAEILSYSRSRGLFAGVSLDGSAIEIDQTANAAYYVAAPGQQPRVPDEATKLVQTIAELSAGTKEVPMQDPRAAGAIDLNAVRGDLGRSAIAMNALLQPDWQRYLALPREVYEGQSQASPDAIAACLRNYEQVAAGKNYASLNQRPEFQRTLEILRVYHAGLTAAGGAKLNLPAPPK